MRGAAVIITWFQPYSPLLPPAQREEAPLAPGQAEETFKTEIQIV